MDESEFRFSQIMANLNSDLAKLWLNLNSDLAKSGHRSYMLYIQYVHSIVASTVCDMWMEVVCQLIAGITLTLSFITETTDVSQCSIYNW